jgi:hypothetical protein
MPPWNAAIQLTLLSNYYSTDIMDRPVHQALLASILVNTVGQLNLLIVVINSHALVSDELVFDKIFAVDMTRGACW